MQNCGLRHLHGTKYFGTPRQLWYSSTLPSKDLYAVVHGQVEHLVEAGTAGTAGVTTGVTTGVTGGGTGGGTGGTGGAGGIGGSAGSVLPYALLVMNGNGVSRPLPANNTPVRLHKNEFLVCQWPDLSHYK